MGAETWTKIKKGNKKFGIKTVFTSRCNLKNLTCRNKSKLLPSSFPGVYQFDCTCNALYIDKTKKKVITRTIEHQQEKESGKAQAQLSIA